MHIIEDEANQERLLNKIPLSAWRKTLLYVQVESEKLLYGSRKSILTQWKGFENLRGGGPTAKVYQGKYEGKLEIPGGGAGVGRV